MRTKKWLLSVAATLLLGFGASAQLKLDNNLSNVYIDGTSSLHDWTETVEMISGNLKADITGATLDKLRILTLSIPVTSIKSGKSGMDKNTYVALKTDKYPNISYVLKTYTIEGKTVHLTGDLTVAGTTKSVTFDAKYLIKDGKVELTGSHTFKMTNFGIEPPTAVMGTIKTGDQITIRFHLLFN